MRMLVAQSTPREPDWLAASNDGLQSLLTIMAVLGVVALCAWLLRRGHLRLPGARANPAVRVETAVSLGERRSLVIVTVEGRRLLLGMTPAQVSLLTPLDDSDRRFEGALDRHAEAPAEPVS